MSAQSSESSATKNTLGIPAAVFVKTDEKDIFYCQLQDILNSVKKGDISLVLGDFNAKVGTDSKLWAGVLGPFGIGSSSIGENGEHLLQEDVENFMRQEENQENAELVLRRLDEQHSKYKFMELNLLQKKRRLKKQIPDIKTSLDILRIMKNKKNSEEVVETQFLLSGQVYAKAKIPPTDKVCLWLGANVMLEYTLQDAEALLTKNLQTASKNLNQLDDDLDFLRDQLTTTEVNMARVYNWDVKRRQAERERSATSVSA